MATAAAKIASQAGPNFRIGGKQVFLPTAVVALVPPRNGRPSNFATFHVPLRFNKLDLRDYLYNCYNVEVLSVRSFIQQSKLELTKMKSDGKPGRTQTKRPESKKFMMVELVKPFVFPSKPADLSPWDHEQYNAVVNEHKSMEKNANMQRTGALKLSSPSAFPVSTSRVLQAQQALALRKGGVKWENNAKLDDKWREVEVGWEAAAEAAAEKKP